jgi:hypothetical protein
MQKIKISHLSMWAETASPGPFPLSRAQPASATHDSSGPLTPDPHCPALSRVLALSSHCWWDPPPPAISSSLATESGGGTNLAAFAARAPWPDLPPNSETVATIPPILVAFALYNAPTLSTRSIISRNARRAEPKALGCSIVGDRWL